jgi:GntR family transcriptional repressor for pyruvate dehydrogenase complex
MANALAIARLSVPKAADVLAAHLRERILTGDFAEGFQLPTERQLSESSGLSRASVREALRVLEIEELIVTRPGRGGGSMVRRPTPESIQRSVELFIRGHQILFRSLLETREAIEPVVARLAAENHTAADLANLREKHAVLEASTHQRDSHIAANLAWHLALAQASHNELLAAFMTAISQAVRAGTDIETFDSDAVRSATVRAHARIMQAIANRDGEAAARRMARHVGAYSEGVAASKSGNVSLEVTRAPQR